MTIFYFKDTFSTERIVSRLVIMILTCSILSIWSIRVNLYRMCNKLLAFKCVMNVLIATMLCVSLGIAHLNYIVRFRTIGWLTFWDELRSCSLANSEIASRVSKNVLIFKTSLKSFKYKSRQRYRCDLIMSPLFCVITYVMQALWVSVLFSLIAANHPLVFMRASCDCTLISWNGRRG